MTGQQREIVGGAEGAIALVEELKGAMTDGSWYRQQSDLNQDTVDCWWDGQNEEGRKNESDLGKEPFPWEDASDTRIRLADEIVMLQQRILTAATLRAQVQAVPIETEADAAEAAAITTLMRWLLHTHSVEELRREIPLLAAWQAIDGAAVLWTSWDQRMRLGRRTLSVEEFAEAATGAAPDDPSGPVLARLVAALGDEAADEESAEILSALHPQLSRSQARSAARRLRAYGQVEIPVPEIGRSRLALTACRVWRDVFFPANTYSLQVAPWVARRELFVPCDLLARAAANGWDTDAAEEASEKVDSTITQEIIMGRRTGRWVEENKGLVECFWFSWRTTDDVGFIEYWTALVHPDVETPIYCAAADGALEGFPCVEFVRERRGRLILESRGVPEIVKTWQAEIKTARDFRADRASVTIIPPLEVPLSRGRQAIVLGPGRKVPVRKSGEIKWLSPPPADPMGDVESDVRGDADRYFGLLSADVAPALQTLVQQAIVDDWMVGLRLVATQAFQLAMHYLPPDVVRRVVRAMPPHWGEAGAVELRGLYDVQMHWSAEQLQPEIVKGKLEALSKLVLPIDSMGVIDLAPVVRWAMRAIDPDLAMAAIRTEDDARASEIEEERSAFAQLYSGVEPPMRDRGQNHGLRAQVLKGIMEANPALQKRFNEDDIFRQMIERRMQHLEFQVQQRSNAVTGRLGVEPAQIQQGGE